MKNLKALFTGKYMLWLIISIPGIFILTAFFADNSSYDMLMHATGEFAARTLIIALIATPIAILFPKGMVSKWLLRNRRYFGVAAFGYTFLHTLFYLIEIPTEKIVAECLELGMLTGWIAFIIFIPLAVTSNDASVRWLKEKWKPLQRWVYLAAILTFAHWVFIEYHWKPAVVHFAPVLLLQVLRIRKNIRQS